MARRKIIAKNEALSGIFLMLSGAAFGASVAGSLEYPVKIGAWLGLAAGTGVFFWQQITGRGGLRINFGGKKKRTHPSAFDSLVPWHVNEGIDDDGIMRWYDKRDKPPEEFVFYGLNLPTKIPESMMLRFCERALQRNRINLDPGRTTYKRTGYKLRSHEVLSEQYFTKSRGFVPRLLPEQYAAIREILELTGFWINRRGGHPGTLLVDWGITPNHLTRLARWGWIDIMIRSEKQNKPFWKM